MQWVGDDKLVGLVVHELRTPVAITRAYAQLLEAQVAERAGCATIFAPRHRGDPVQDSGLAWPGITLAVLVLWEFHEPQQTD